MFATLDRELSLDLALCALQLQHDFLRSFSLLSEDGLSLTTETSLLAIVTPSTLSKLPLLTLLVL